MELEAGNLWERLEKYLRLVKERKLLTDIKFRCILYFYFKDSF